jgi:heme exporter protein D
MSWTSLGEFFNMGGYGLYVWGSYAATLVVMAVEAVLVRKRLQAAVGALSRPEASI